MGQNPDAYLGPNVGLEPAQIVFVAIPVGVPTTEYGIFVTRAEADNWNITHAAIQPKIGTGIELNVPTINYFGEPVILRGNLKDANENLLPNKKIVCYIGGINIPHSTNADGAFEYHFMNPAVGTYLATVKFPGDSEYEATSSEATFSVEYEYHEPERVETYREYEIWTRWVAGRMDYTTPSPVDAASPTIEGIRMAIDSYIKSITPEPEPELVEVYRGYEIWTRPQYNDYTTPPPIHSASSSIDGLRMAIDRYIQSIFEWTPEQRQIFVNSGLTDAEINTIPIETTDMIDAEFAVPKIGFGLNVPSVDDIKRKVNDELLAEGVDAEIVGVVYHKVGGRSWWDWYDGWKCWLFVRSPLAITGAITIGFALKIALAFFCAAVLVYWKWSEVRVAEIKSEDISDINDVVTDILANPDLTDEQKQAIIDKLLETHQKATEEDKSWVDKLMELAPIGLLGAGLLLVLTMMPRRRD